MPKKLEKYTEFVQNLGINRKFKFEEMIIDPIISIIRENQKYLTKPENLPQLAKLGWMYNTLWYAGRVCWGYDGILLDPEIIKSLKTADDLHEEDPNNPYTWISCEDNPKYKIEECQPEDDEIENWIYDAWGMHVSNELSTPTYTDFVKKLKEGRPLTDFDRKRLKPNKTMEEWVEVLTDKQYPYHSIYPDRKAVLNHLMCTIGYGISKDGFIYTEASGADQDETSYGDWENAKFRRDIEARIEQLLQYPELKATLNTCNKYESDLKAKKKEEEKKRWSFLKDVDIDDEDFDIDELLAKLHTQRTGTKMEPTKPKYKTYYPISSSSIIFKITDEEAKKREGITKVDPSYINAAIEICKDILAHEEEETSSPYGHKTNPKYAREILGKLGVDGFIHKGPDFDKYELLKDIKDAFSDFTNEFDGEEITNRISTDYNSWYLYLDDTAKSAYGSNNYTFCVQFSKDNSLPKGASRSIEFLSPAPFYNDLKISLGRLESMKKTYPEIKLITFSYDNLDSIRQMVINIIVNSGYVKQEKEQDQTDKEFSNLGFEVGGFYMILPIDNMKFVARKAKTLGSTHPNNKSGREYYSNALQLIVYNSDYSRKLATFQVDERGFNSIHPQHINDKSIGDWVIKQHEEMKKSDSGYGFGKREGSKKLYVHDFMLWLREHKL